MVDDFLGIRSRREDIIEHKLFTFTKGVIFLSLCTYLLMTDTIPVALFIFFFGFIFAVTYERLAE